MARKKKAKVEVEEPVVVVEETTEEVVVETPVEVPKPVIDRDKIRRKKYYSQN